MICGKLRYLSQGHLARGWTKITCGSRECRSLSMMGENNHFWNKHHTDEAREAIKIGLAKNPPKGTGPKKGEFTHTPEARAAIAEHNRKRWLENRDLMLSQIPKGENHPYHQIERELRHRLIFTTVQKELWTDKECFYCKSQDNLILDHIIPVMAGGQRSKSNSQTLCEPCNRWKLKYVDLPFYFAFLDSKGGQT